MAILEDDVKARIPADILIQATNDEAGDGSIDDAKLTLAATDVKADFIVFANVIYDEANATHVSAAIFGVFLKLLTYKIESDFIDRYETWAELRLDKYLRRQKHNNRILPKTTSRLRPTREQEGETPWFDAERSFRDLIPDQFGDRFDIRQLR